jgi:hypothetical protein
MAEPTQTPTIVPEVMRVERASNAMIANAQPTTPKPPLPDPVAAKRVMLYARISRELLWALAILMIFFSAAMVVPSFIFHRALDFPIVLAAGVIGGFVSLQRRLKNLTDEDLQLLSMSRVYIWLSPFVGGIFAALLFLLFLSGMLADAVFPHFEYDKSANAENLSRLFHMRSTDPADYAKLFFWSFVAGFSEMFVVNIIEKFDRGSGYGPTIAPATAQASQAAVALPAKPSPATAPTEARGNDPISGSTADTAPPSDAVAREGGDGDWPTS